MRCCNPDLGTAALWHQLRLWGYTRRPESLFRGMHKLGLFSAAEKEKAYKPKPYEQMAYPGQRVQMDVKVVPHRCIVDPELHLFQYTAIDEFTNRFSNSKQDILTLDDFAKQFVVHNRRSNNIPVGGSGDFRQTGSRSNMFNESTLPTKYLVYMDDLKNSLGGENRTAFAANDS